MTKRKSDGSENESKADIVYSQDGSTMLFLPVSEAGLFWVKTFLPDDAPRFGKAYMFDNEYADDVILRAEAAGLVVLNIAAKRGNRARKARKRKVV